MANNKKKSNVNSSNMTRLHITYHDRMSRDHSHNCKCPICKRTPIYEDVSVQVYDEKLNRVVKKSQKKVVDNKEFLSQFKCSDFSLDILISTGAIAKMNSCTLHGSRFNSISNVDKLMNTMLESVSDVADFTVDVSGGQNDWRGFRLTPLGRRVYKMFISLGMKFTFSFTTRGFVSALPLFCAGRIYLDWFYTSQYAHTTGYTAIQKYLIKNDDVVDVGESFVPYEDLAVICTTLSTIFYEPDYFTSAWDNPTGPNTGLQSSITITDLQGGSSSTGVIATSTDADISSEPRITTNLNNSPSSISSYILTAVKKLADYMKRNQLAGARALDRFYARFGIQIPAEALNRSYLVGEFSHYIQFGDVTSMASTDSATLGDYAGKGVTFGNGNFEFSGKERGYFIVITSIIPKTYYYQGVDRMAQHVSRLDFWTEEFDGLGVQALSKAEVYKPQDSFTDSMITDTYDNEVFGFVPRYAEYKTSSAILSGDYILRSRNVGKDAWTLFRNVRPDHDEPLDEFKHDIFFVKGTDANQYNRIFYNTSENADHFNVIHQFRLKVSFPGKSLYDTYEFDNEENSKRVEMGIGGTQLS